MSIKAVERVIKIRKLVIRALVDEGVIEEDPRRPHIFVNHQWAESVITQYVQAALLEDMTDVISAVGNRE
jgi:hypothetical protein